jgi:hypothetical protein
MEEITALRTRLANFLKQLKESETVMTNRAARIWNSKIATETDLDHYLDEIEFLIRAFEGCDEDIEDFLVMKNALQMFKRYYSQSADINLSWAEWNSLIIRLREEANDLYGEEEALPWSLDETFTNFDNNILKLREQTSLAWIESLESKVSRIKNMSVAEANNLHSETNSPPATLTVDHSEKLKNLVAQIDERLECLELEWLVEKFKKLPITTKKKFLEMIPQFADIP